ncbi:MAG: class III signal peptide-containing protein [archaeon]
MRAQGAMEYMIMITAVLVIASIIILFMTGVFKTTKSGGDIELCKQAAARCQQARLTNPNDPCNFCDEACSSNGVDILDKSGGSAIDCCKLGNVSAIYEGSKVCPAFKFTAFWIDQPFFLAWNTPGNLVVQVNTSKPATFDITLSSAGGSNCNPFYTTCGESSDLASPGFYHCNFLDDKKPIGPCVISITATSKDNGKKISTQLLAPITHNNSDPNFSFKLYSMGYSCGYWATSGFGGWQQSAPSSKPVYKVEFITNNEFTYTVKFVSKGGFCPADYEGQSDTFFGLFKGEYWFEGAPNSEIGPCEVTITAKNASGSEIQLKYDLPRIICP